MDRIEINGEWYVREKPEDKIDNYAYYFQGYVYENEICMFEATSVDVGEDVTIKFINKKNKGVNGWKEEFFDNPTWMVNVYEGDVESIKNVEEIMSNDIVKIFKQFLGFLIEKSWLKQ